MTFDEVLLAYQRRLTEVQAGLAQARLHSISAACLLGVAAAILLLLGVLAIRNQIPVWWPSLPVPFAAASAHLFRKRRHAMTTHWRLRRFCERSLDRVRGQWIGRGHTGEEFDDPQHPYAHDLDLFGRGSLFELLSTARSAIGNRGIAAYLLNRPPPGETRARSPNYAAARI